MFFEANDITDARKVSVLLTIIGKHNFSLLRNLVASDAPKDKLFNELLNVFKMHFEPKKLVIAKHFNFYRQEQYAGESIMGFIADLRCLTLRYSSIKPFVIVLCVKVRKSQRITNLPSARRWRLHKEWCWQKLRQKRDQL